jgi:hypothetical protein
MPNPRVALGLGLLGLVFAGLAVDAWRLSTLPVLVAALGGWFVLKDWRDVRPQPGTRRRGDSGSTAEPLPSARRAAPTACPRLAAAVAFAVGLVNLASALTPNIAWRHHLLLQAEPASFALVMSAFPLRRWRRRARRAESRHDRNRLVPPLPAPRASDCALFHSQQGGALGSGTCAGSG